MKPHHAHNLAAYGAAGRFDLVIECLLLALLAFMPFAFGAVQAWSEQVVVMLAAAMTLVLAVKLVMCPEARFTWTWGLVPVVLFLALGAMQLVPFPADVLTKLSPATTELRQELLADVPDAPAVLARQTISLYPHATRHNLVVLLAVVAVFVTVSNVYRRTRQTKRLLWGIAIIGAAVALLGMWQFFSGTSAVYGIVPTANRASGPFVNHSHFGQFMNLSIGAALGLLLVYVEEIFGRKEASLPAFFERMREGKVRAVWCLAGMIVLAAFMVFLSMSRGGMLALLVGGALTAAALTLTRRQAGRASLVVLLGTALFLGVLYLEFDSIYNRAASILHFEKSEGGRAQILTDLTQVWARFPVFGTGLGTHETVFPMFDRSNSSSIAAHAENEYAQVTEEAGLLGFALVAAFLVWMAWNYLGTVRRVHIPVQAAAYGLGFGLLAILAHSFTDFGQHVPANACLTAVSIALLANLARRSRKQSETAVVSEHLVPSQWRVARAAVPVALSALLVVNIPWVNAARKAEGQWAQAFAVEEELQANAWQGSDDRYATLLRHAQTASEWQPDNIHYRFGLNEYRWRAISRQTEAGTGRLLMTEQSMAFARRIAGELHRARPLCPTFGMTYSLAGQIEAFVLADPAGAGHIRRGYALSGWDAGAAATAAELDAAEGLWDEASSKLRAAVARGYSRAAAVDMLLRGGRAELAMALAAGNADALRHLASRLEQAGVNADLATAARAQARELLEKACARPDAVPDDLATLAAQSAGDGDHARAVELYRRALARNYDDVGWRMGLASALAETGQVDLAMHEARICLRLRPRHAGAEKLIGELSTRRRASSAG